MEKWGFCTLFIFLCVLTRSNRRNNIIRMGVEAGMEKNRIRPVVKGNSMRMSYSRRKEVLDMPNLIEVQKDSYKWFLDEGLREAFDDISPITDYSGKLKMDFVSFKLDKSEIKHTINECRSAI